MSTSPLPSSTRQNTGTLLIRSLSYLKPYRKMTLLIYLTMVLINAISLSMPQFIRWIIDAGVYGNNIRILSLAVAALLGLGAIRALLTYFQGRLTEVASQNVAYDLRNQIMQRLTSLSFSFHDRTETGQVLSRSIQDVERIRFLTGRALLRIVEGLLLMLGTAVILIWMDPILGLLVFLILPVLIHRAYLFGRNYRPLSLKIQDQLGVLTSKIEQNLRGAQIVKVFAQEQAEIDRFQEENDVWFELSIQAVRLEAINVPLLNLVANLGTVLIIGYGGLQVFQGSLTLGELVAFTTYLAMLVRPLNLVGRIIPILAIAASAAERIFEILDSQPDVRDHPGVVVSPDIQGAVRFDNVSFGYNKTQPVIQNVSFKVDPGQVVALLGTTGSGKSTIINLIPRFYEPTSGKILIDNHESNRFTIQSLRDHIGIVLQDTVLFAASIRENIAFGAPDASDEDIIKAASDAQAHDFILQMPNGYYTRVGERGVTLSGGQKQRIAIARALLKNPRILLLDDATSSVDTNTERQIQKALTRLMQGRTTFVIAHRLSTIRKANLILVLEKGRIVAQGTHEYLLGNSPYYAKIYNRQLLPQKTRIFGGIG